MVVVVMMVLVVVAVVLVGFRVARERESVMVVGVVGVVDPACAIGTMGRWWWWRKW